MCHPQSASVPEIEQPFNLLFSRFVAILIKIDRTDIIHYLLIFVLMKYSALFQVQVTDKKVNRKNRKLRQV